MIDGLSEEIKDLEVPLELIEQSRKVIALLIFEQGQEDIAAYADKIITLSDRYLEDWAKVGIIEGMRRAILHITFTAREQPESRISSNDSSLCLTHNESRFQRAIILYHRSFIYKTTRNQEIGWGKLVLAITIHRAIIEIENEWSDENFLTYRIKEDFANILLNYFEEKNDETGNMNQFIHYMYGWDDLYDYIRV